MGRGWLILLLLPALCGGAEPPSPRQGPWEAAAHEAGLSREEVSRLGTEKLLIAGPPYRQCFEAYLKPQLPIFITSDSLLQGYHILFEESILHLERVRARQFQGIFHPIWDNLTQRDLNLKGDARLIAAARRRASIVLAVGLRLSGDDRLKIPLELASIVDAEVARVQEAKAVDKPAWLGPPTPGFDAIDYSRFKPRGFYTQSEELQRYFRATAWLAAIPFDIESDEELLAILLLGQAASEHKQGRFDGAPPQTQRYFDTFDRLLGPGDDLDLMAARRQTFGKLQWELNAANLAEKRKAVRQKVARIHPQINDQRARMRQNSFRVLSAHRTPDAVLFSRLMNARFPVTGLEVGAVLGSPLARNELGNPDLLAIIDQSQPLFAALTETTLYGEYLQCLRTLFEPPGKDVPSLFATPAWQAKNLQTALSGWAQLRHTWTLQAKENVVLFGDSHSPSGFVEPNPEFFSRLADLSNHSRELLRESGAFERDPSWLAAEIRWSMKLLSDRIAAGHGKRVFQDASDGQRPRLDALSQVFGAVGISLDEDLPEKYPAASAKLEKLSADLEQGHWPADELLSNACDAVTPELDTHWLELERTALRLESLAHKQIRNQPFNDRDQAFLKEYGHQLAQIMLYQGQSCLTPRDDAPRAVDIAMDPSSPRSYFHVAIARPRPLYLLYPAQGQEILCRGAVLPYREFEHPTRLTDTDWKTLLDSPSPPPPPLWIERIWSATAPKRPAKGGGHQ